MILTHDEIDNNNLKQIKKHLCSKCEGIVVNSFLTNLMAAEYGKRCEC